MELLYLWVDNFRKFEKAGFNFSSLYDIQSRYYEGYQQTEHVEIIIGLKDNYVNLFPPNFLNITAIVGENAAGKSTLIQLLKLMAGDFQKLAARIIFCYRLKEAPNTIHTVYYKSGKDAPPLTVRLKRTGGVPGMAAVKFARPVPYTLKPGQDFINKNIIFRGIENSRDQVSTIFFTNSFEPNHEDFISGIFNISTNARLHETVKEYLDEIYKKEKPSRQVDLLRRNSPVFNFFEKELKQLIEFIPFAKRNEIDTRVLPDFLSIGFNKSDFEYLLSKEYSLRWNRQTLREIDKKAMEQIARKTDPHDRIISIISLLSVYYLLREDLLKKSDLSDFEKANKTLAGIAAAKDVIEAIRQFLLSVRPTDSMSKLNKIRNVANGTLDEALKKASFKPMPNNQFRFDFDINEDLWEFLQIIFENKYPQDPPFLDFFWYGLSSGQEAFLKQFARFFSIKSDIANTVLWVLIDEGDLYFHPQWQKEYFSLLIDFLTKVYGNCDIQLIFSSHSPFVLSDLPKNNVIFLSRERIEDPDDIKETFGANIHTLFSSSFFLKGLTGDFARKKIDEAIMFLNGDNQTTFKSVDEVQGLISIIGEPILRSQLQKMLDSRRLKFIQDKMASLETRVSNLENKLGEA